jgi:hypothetical protein
MIRTEKTDIRWADIISRDDEVKPKRLDEPISRRFSSGLITTLLVETYVGTEIAKLATKETFDEGLPELSDQPVALLAISRGGAKAPGRKLAPPLLAGR